MRMHAHSHSHSHSQVTGILVLAFGFCETCLWIQMARSSCAGAEGLVFGKLWYMHMLYIVL
jgi:hypothetical protein